MAADQATGLKLAPRLRRRGYFTAVAQFGQEKLDRKCRPRTDVILLCPMRTTGERNWWREVRSRGPLKGIPVLKISRQQNYLDGLTEFQRLIQRIQAFEEHRRHRGPGGDVLEHSGISIDPIRCQAAVHGRPLYLASLDYQILECFLRHPGQIFSRRELLAATVRPRPVVSERSIDRRITSLRRALEVPGLIETIPGRGYRLREHEDGVSDS